MHRQVLLMDGVAPNSLEKINDRIRAVGMIQEPPSSEWTVWRLGSVRVMVKAQKDTPSVMIGSEDNKDIPDVLILSLANPPDLCEKIVVSSYNNGVIKGRQGSPSYWIDRLAKKAG